MTFPEDPLDVRAELQIGDAWTDVTADAQSGNPITITCGRTAHGARTSPGSCSFTLNNRLGRYSPRNPRSPYFGLIGRNTPVRISVPGPEAYLAMTGAMGDSASTAPPGVTGDLDVRIEASTDWYRTGDHLLIGQWQPGVGDGEVWQLRLVSGTVLMAWTLGGVDGPDTRSTRSLLPEDLPERAAVRVTLDVDNGSGGFTVVLYSAPSIDGPWVRFREWVIEGELTSIYGGTQPLEIAPSYTNTAGAARPPIEGRVWAAQVYDGIDGTPVVDVDFTSQTPGATSITDATGNTWTLNGDVAIANREYRFVGEVAEWPTHWTPGTHREWVTLTAAGILRRLGQGTKALQSALRRRVPSYNPLAYWPMEEGESATQAYSPVEGVGPLVTSGFAYAQADGLASSGPLPQMASVEGRIAMHGTIPAPSEPITGWQLRWIYRLDRGPVVQRTHMRFKSSGTVADWFVMQSDGDGSRILGYDSEGATVVDQGIATGSDLYGQWVAINVRTSQSGSTVTWSVSWQDIGGDAAGYSGSYTGTIGHLTEVSTPNDGYSSDLDGMAIGHIGAVGSTLTNAYVRGITAWTGETARERLLRLSDEEALPLRLYGAAAGAMGPQRQATILDLVQECADVDGGILCEHRDSLSLLYRSRETLYNQPAGLVLDYTAAGEVAPPLLPVDDDQAIRNDRTVKRTSGSSARAALEEGPLSVLDPPDGVGRYDETITLNLANDEQAEPIAYWLLHQGTWDEARYPKINVHVHRAPWLIPQVLGLQLGDKITIDHPPPSLPPDQIAQLAQGYTEVLGIRTWRITYTCTPAGPWQIGRVGDETARVDAEDSELTAAVDETATVLPVTATLSEPWTSDPIDLPWDIRVGGEVMTVTAVTGDGSAPTTDAASQSSLDTGAASTDHIAPSVTAPGAADLLICAWVPWETTTAYTVPGSMTLGASTVGVWSNFTDATEPLAASGATGTRTATVAAADQWAALSVVVSPAVAGTPVVEEHLSAVEADATNSHNPGPVVLTTAADTQAGWWLLTLQGWDNGASLSPGGPTEAGWTELTTSGLAGANIPYIGAWAKQAAGGAETVTLPQGDADDNHARLYVISGIGDAAAQQLTVTRSVNGIAKTHSAGADVRLAHPTYVAL